MPWEKPQIDKAATVSALKEATALVGPVVSISITVIEAVKAFVEGLLTFLVAVVDPSSAALQVAIDAARAILDDLTKGAGCHFIALPIRDVNLQDTESVYIETFHEGAPSGGITLVKPTHGSGGNAGFIEELSNSLSDQGDILRPQFDEEAFVAGLVFLYGSSNYIQVEQLVRKLIQLFTGASDALGDPRLPIPRGLNARFVPKSINRQTEVDNRAKQEGTPVHPYAVKLAWQPAEEDISLFEGKVRFQIRDVVVMRAEKPLLKMTENERTEHVLKEFSFNNGLINSFYDDTIELNKKYYYAVGYLLNVLDEDGEVEDELDTPYDITQVLVNVPSQIASLPSRGIPPDWVMAASPLSYVPPIIDLVDKIN